VTIVHFLGNMSLLDAAGMMTGDIWLSGAFNFESPLKDLLDSEEYTLEQLLAEDELLQEVRGIHPQLIENLSKEKAVATLVQYVILPPGAPRPPPLVLSHKEEENKDEEEKETSENDENKADDEPEKEQSEQEVKDEVYVRFPYMACEVICCEMKGIVDAIVDGFVPDSTSDIADKDPRPTRILDLLFSMLYDSKEGEIDDYRAGYFDKILSVLFRKRPQAMSQYINEGGGKGDTVLMEAMLNHLYSHSLMQIVQRLLLPQPPLPSKEEEGDDDQKGDDLYTDHMESAERDGLDLFRCSWSESEVALEMLLDCLIGQEQINPVRQEEEERLLNLYLNASEVLITIIQNSPLTSPTLKVLTTDPVLKKLMVAASLLDDGTSFSPHDSKVTCAMNVMESLILQLGGYGSVGMMFPEEDEEGEGEEGYNDEEPPPDMATSETLIEHLPMMLSNLCNLLLCPEAENWVSPMQFSRREPQKLLGSSRLKIVRLLESLVLLGDPGVDALLCGSKCMEICLDLFWKFQWCSMLHQSVANLLVHVLEGQNARSELQSYFVENCNLLGLLMDSFWEEGKICNAASADNRLSQAVMAMKSTSVPTSSVASERGSVNSKDDIIPVSDDDVDAVLEQEESKKGHDESGTGKGQDGHNELVEHAPAQSFRLGYMGHVIIICQALVHACTSNGANSEDPSLAGGNPEDNGELDNFVIGQNIEAPKAGEPSLGADSATEGTCTPLVLAELVGSHELNSRWQDFISTTLASETAIQSTPLGGFHGSPLGTDPLHSHRPGLADDGDYTEDDGAAPPLPPRGVLVGGDAIDMDDNDLDVAASMMAGLSMRRDVDGSDMLAGIPHEPDTGNSRGYMFDDPLGDGRFGKFDDDGDSSSDEESDVSDNTGGSGGGGADGPAPPVMDLFAGNFDLGDQKPDSLPKESFGNFDDAFANFDNAFAGTGDSSGPTSDNLPSTPNGDVADLFGDTKDHVALLDTEESPEKRVHDDDDGSHSSADDGSHSSDEEPAKADINEPGEPIEATETPSES
jgi:hypothetical protein